MLYCVCIMLQFCKVSRCNVTQLLVKLLHRLKVTVYFLNHSSATGRLWHCAILKSNVTKHFKETRLNTSTNKNGTQIMKIIDRWLKILNKTDTSLWMWHRSIVKKKKEECRKMFSNHHIHYFLKNVTLKSSQRIFHKWKQKCTFL